MSSLSITESVNPLSENLDSLATEALVQLFVEDHKSVLKAIHEAKAEIALVIDAVSQSLKNGGSLIYVGAGTSGRLGILDAVECPPTFSTEPDLVKAVIAGGDKAIKHAVEGAEDDEEAAYQDVFSQVNSPEDFIIGISASGGAAYVVGALKAARERGSKTAIITNNANAEIINYADFSIILNTGAELLSGSTRLKAGTSQKMVLNIISTSAMIKLGKTYGNLMVDVKVSNKKLKARAIRLIRLIVGCDEEAATEALALSRNKVKQAVLYLKKGLDFEAATKLLELNGGFLSSVLG